MKYKCVSYPEFEPDHTWLRQILLFVDEIYRIVPAHEQIDDSDELKRLMEHCEGAVRRCPPQSYVRISASQAALFGKALDQTMFKRIAEAKQVTMKIGPAGAIQVEGWEFLHIEKIGERVHNELKKRTMIRQFFDDSRWRSVPRGVSGLVLSMVADNIARENGFDAITDKPLAFALNAWHECTCDSQAHVEGMIASTVATAHVPADIALLPAKDYAEFRARHSEVRAEFAKMVRELKNNTRLDRIADPVKFRRRLDEIVDDVSRETEKFRNSKSASKFNKWVPLVMTSLLPVAVTYAFGPIPGVASGLFSFGVNAVAKLSEKTVQFAYPKVLQTLCAANDTAAKAALRKLRL